MNLSSEQVSDNAVEGRLKELLVEQDKGQRHLEMLEQRSQEVRHTLLRISGAIQVLEDLLRPHNGEHATPDVDSRNTRIST